MKDPMTAPLSGTPAGSEPDSPMTSAVFLSRYLSHAGAQLPGRPVGGLYELAREHALSGNRRLLDQTTIAVRDLDAETTIIDVVTGDVPYLVDSAVAELARTGHPVRHLLHPQLVVRRGPDGTLLAIVDIDDLEGAPEDATVESWMHIETDLIPADEHAAVATDLSRVLVDVHAAQRDAAASYALLEGLADRIGTNPGKFDRDTSTEAAALLRWLADGNFQILGHAAYSANELANPAAAQAGDGGTAESGVLSGDISISALELLPAYRSGAPVVIFKSPMVSSVRRSARYDCVTVMEPETEPHLQAGSSPERIHVFLGLLEDDAESSIWQVPVLRRRIAEALRRSGARPNSHTERRLLAALRTLPRDELLQSTSADLLKVANLVVDRAEGGGIGIYTRTHLNRDFVSVLVYFPGDRLGPETRRRVRDTVLANWPGRMIGRDDRIVGLGMARMHFLIALRPGEEVPHPDRATVEATVAHVTRRWSDDLSDLLTLRVGEQQADRILRRFGAAVPEAYKEDFPASTAVADLVRLESLPARDGLGFEVYIPDAGDPADRRLKIFRSGSPLSLGRTLPMLERMGIEVLDERPYEIEGADGSACWIYDFGLKLAEGVDFSADRSAAVIETLRMLWQGAIEQDGFNALVVRAGLTWQQAVVLRSYAKYLRQTGSTFSEGYVEQTLSQYPAIAALLVQLFEIRFDPHSDPHGDAHSAEHGEPSDADAGAETAVRVQLGEALAQVASLDQDRILRSLLGLINATLRTNYFQPQTEDSSRTFAIKVDSAAVPDLPQPRPKVEIWVYSPRVEGIHLRFGLVARGGLRWSDRREDFRTEILGLVKAQMVKNVVIVPVGSKGGFVAKNAPDPATDRSAWLAEGIACYKAFITALLELTDDYRRDGSGRQYVAKPAATRSYDGDDPYLVVAADKGTATFSDIANGIALQRGFWLGDAFASGGSVGYDHKEMGITARGAWESVRYHFAELGLDPQTQPFTAVGIGDMSGDVFGNGMLLSRCTRLVAAFDHRCIFLDPNPDAATSFSERERLYALPQSSWTDYNQSLISAGGGVFRRTDKSIPISPEIAERLALPPGTASLAPAVLIHAILTAPVDLLWNGGIGTYVKASSEAQVEASDKANDAVRADAEDLRCRVVGEGGNLGFTQRGRIAYARAGGRINTDAIDNSAGVDTSDHEVNIKILLDSAIRTGALAAHERTPMLEAATDEVALLVLNDNYEQNVLLGVARHGAASLCTVHRRLIRAMEKSGALMRAIEFLPTDKELAARQAADLGLTSPELAVLAAYAKIGLTEQIRASSIPAEVWFRRYLSGYFPTSIAARLDGELDGHPLAPEIIATGVTNDLVNRAGLSFVFRIQEEIAVDVAQIVRAYTVVREVFGLRGLWQELADLADAGPVINGVITTTAQHSGYREIRRTMDRAVRWLLDVRFPLTDVTAEIARFTAVVDELAPALPEFLRGRERQNLDDEIARLTQLGLPEPLAARISGLLTSFLLLDVTEIAVANQRPAREVAELHFALSEQLSVDDLLYGVTGLPRADRWSALARAAIRHDVYAALAAVTTSVLLTTDPQAPVLQRLQQWTTTNQERVDRVRLTLTEALAREPVDLATLSVALRGMRGLPV